MVKIHGKQINYGVEMDIDYSVYYKGNNVRLEAATGVNGGFVEIYNHKENATYSYLTDVQGVTDYTEGNTLGIEILSVGLIGEVEKDPALENYIIEIESDYLFIEREEAKKIEKFWYYLMDGVLTAYYAEFFDEQGYLSHSIEWEVIEIENRFSIDDRLFDIPEEAKTLN